MIYPIQLSVFIGKIVIMRHGRGFSLYEALVVLTVVGTVSAIAVPAFQQLASSQRISSAVNALVTALHLARSETIKRGEIAVLCPSPDGNNCLSDEDETVWEQGYLLFMDRNGNHEYDTDESVIRIFGATEGVHIRTSARRDHVTYHPNGMALGSNLTFTFCDKHGRVSPRAVILSASGRPRTSTRDAGGSEISCPAPS